MCSFNLSAKIFFGGASVVLSTQVLADFVSDSKATLSFRNFYYNNDNRNSSATQSKIEEWAQGFMLDYKSGYTDGTIGFGVDALGMLGVTLDSGKGTHLNNTMIPSDSDGRAVGEWSRLGLTGKMRISQTEFKYGTLFPKLPILVYSDGRVLPQTYVGGQVVSNEFRDVTLTAGRIESSVGRGSTDRTGLSVAGGTRESDHFDYAGVDWKVNKDLLAQYYYAKMDDYYVQQFLGLTHIYAVNDNQSLKTDLRYFSSKGTGANEEGAAGYRATGYTKNGDGKINNTLWSATFIYSLINHTFTLGYQSSSDNSGFFQPNQGGVGKGAGGVSTYSYTDRLVFGYQRAGEQTTYAGYGYDFIGWGIPGLKASMIYLDGRNIKLNDGPRRKEFETNYYIDYVVQGGTFKGVGFGLRQGFGRSETYGDVDQTRAVVSYSLPLF